ncbi:MAG TPA: Hsp20/alpha crystallin family protein [bacterium]|nr:Hsp20/alpha crystallin family protein [bacterium]
MFQIFKVSDEEARPGHDEGIEDEISVRIADEEYSPDEVGQVAVDILETDRAIIIIAPVAGIAPDEIEITLARNIMTLSGNRVRPAVYSESRQTLVGECFFGPFSRSIILPENLALNKIRATIDNNLLQIEIPKLQFASKTIKIDKLEG